MTKWLRRVGFVLYLLILFRITVFRGGWYSNEFVRGEIDWIPFQRVFDYLFDGDWFSFVYLFFGNILWFVPFGLYLGYKGQGIWKVALWTFFLSLSIESLQFVLSSGISEIEDLILNTFGGVAGSLLYRMIFQNRSG